MKLQKLYPILFCLLSGTIYSQTNANSNIIKKDIKTTNGIDIIDYFDPNNHNRKLSPKVAKIPVYYNRKFYSQDIMKKINPDSIASIEIIKIPDSISKDLRSIIYIRKKI